MKVSNENDFTGKLCNKLTEHLRLPKGIRIDAKTKLLKDIAILLDKNRPKIRFYFSEADVVVYDPLETTNPTANEITHKLDELEFVDLFRLNVTNGAKIIYPLVILELKNSRVNTHEYLAYREKFLQWKQLFPKVKIAFIMNHKQDTPEKTRRNLLIYDKIFALQDKFDEFTATVEDIAMWISNEVAINKYTQ